MKKSVINELFKDSESVIETVWPFLTDMEAAIAFLTMEGWNQNKIAKHFELSRQRIRQLLNAIGKKIVKLYQYEQIAKVIDEEYR